MDSTMQTFSELLKILRESAKTKEKCEALTYARSLCMNTELSGTIKGEEYKELCKLVIELFTNKNNSLQQEASDTLCIMIQSLKNHPLHVFESVMPISRKDRLKFLKLLEGIDDTAVAAVANEGMILDFFNNCLNSVQPTTMKWLAPVTCAENMKILSDIEKQNLSEEEKLEEDITNCAVALLQRLYKIASLTLDSNIQRFDTLVMDKVVMLAYMGHKRQRTPALRVLQQAILTNLPSHIRADFPNIWASYKAALLSAYYKRMLLLAEACETDWSKQWNISIQFLGTDLHRGSVLINNLLSVEERAFKSTDTIIRRQAFLSWKLLIDNFALNPTELATTRRIKLLCIPLNAKNSKTELIALTKLEVWWHLIIKVYKDIAEFANLIITHYLNFCFGPLGDTPLLSSKCDIVASPGKRFFKTKLVAVDSLCQLLMSKEEISPVFPPILDERLPHCIPDTVFQECYQSIIHSVGEALLILAQFTDKELKSRYQISVLLWKTLISYIQKSKAETKNSLCKNIFMVITELGNHVSERAVIKNLILDCVLTEIVEIVKPCDYSELMLYDLVLKLLSPELVKDMNTSHCDTIKYLLWQYIKPRKSVTYHSGTLQVCNTLLDKLKLQSTDCNNVSVFAELWCVIAEILTKFMEDSQDINEGNAAAHQFPTIMQALSFPLQYIFLEDLQKLQETTKTWKSLYKQFDLQADLVTTVKHNEILLSIVKIMKRCSQENKKCLSFIVNCLDALLNTINYKHLLEENDTTIIEFITDLTVSSFTNEQSFLCETLLKLLSALLITVYGLDTEKAMKYLEISKPVIELMLLSSSDVLMKEIVSTWETVVSVFKGLNKFLNRDLLQLYKYTIIRAISHFNVDIRTQALFILEVLDKLDENVKISSKDIVAEIMTEIKENKCVIKSQQVLNGAEKGQKVIQQVKASGSFLSKKPASPTPMLSKQKDKEDKKVVLPPDPSSQDYVFIKTDLKFDVNRLTEHQKESLKRRRDDIPALYNDLSQSSSQDSQELQEMFNRKINKTCNVNESKKAEKKEDDETTCDLNARKKTLSNKSTSSQDPVVERGDVHVKETKRNEFKGEPQEALNSTTETNFSPAEKLNDTTKEDTKTNEKDSADIDSVKNRPTPISCISRSLSPEEEITERQERPSEFVAKKLNFESREEFPEDKEQGRTSPSVLDNDKRRVRNIMKISSDQQDGKSTKEDEQDETKIVSRSLGRTGRQVKPDSEDKLVYESRRGVKRKCTSDSDSEGSARPRRRRKFGSSGAEVHSDSDSGKSLSQRTKNEISRLRIDMVFDCPPNRRRSKNDPNVKSQPHSEEKGSKSKCLDSKAVETTRRRSKVAEKEADVSSINKKQKRRSAKVEVNKTDITVDKNDATNDKLKVVETKDNNDAEESQDNTTTPLKVEEKVTTDPVDTENEKVAREEEEEPPCEQVEKPVNTKEDSHVIEQADKPVTKTALDNNVTKRDGAKTTVPNVNTESDTLSSIAELSQSQDVDFVESSQESPSVKLDKKCSERLCFIKIDKLDVMPVQKDESVTGKSPVQQPEGISNDAANGNTEGEKSIPIEQQKSDGSPAKVSYIPTYSSPQSNTKRTLRRKMVTPQGRGAHMLGLVTKQTLLENDGAKSDDETVAKKPKAKDTNYEALSIRKERLVLQKDSETVIRGSASGSRQEKIFSNMRSSEYCSSPPLKLFSNLKNDGEKISPKMDKHSADTTSTHGIDKENDGNTSPSREKDELPILEWSSANPPSLTASPSASILKRHKMSVAEQEQEQITPIKKKRVSFADPPVSKEMGYEIVSTGSPHKVNKPTTRSSTFRKDSPLRLKQCRLRLIQVDSERTGREEGAGTVNLSEVQLQCDRENEILTKIAEELEFPEPTVMDVDNEMPGTSKALEKADDLAQSSNTNKVTISNLSSELELVDEMPVKDLPVAEGLEEKVKNAVTNESKGMEIQESGTEQDVLSDVDGKESNVLSTSELTSSVNSDILLESFKLDSTDSAMSVTKDGSKTDTLEDTVDVANLTELNTTESSEEDICKPIRCSTQKTENVAEMDTLPIPDTNLATQDTQNVSQVNAVISKPELLDSTNPIYPSLVSCKDPVAPIIKELTNPLWIQYLTTYFGDKGLWTISDLARLSEREINRIPVKGSPKVDFVRKVLRHYENTQITTARTPVEQKSNEKNLDEIAGASTTADFSMSERSVVMATSEANQLTCSTPLSQASSKDNKCHSVDTASVTVSVAALNETTESILTDNSAGTPFIAPRTPQGQPTEMSATSTVSASAMNFSTSTTNQPVSRPISSIKSQEPSPTSNELSTANESVINPAMQTTLSIGTETDFPSPTKLSTKTVSKSVASQMALDELLDEMDVNLVLESAVRRCSPEILLARFKEKLKHRDEEELIKETIRMLGVEDKPNYDELTLKSACRACGVNKVLLRLPDIFGGDKEFFAKVLNAYRRKITPSDCLEVLDIDEVKSAFCQKCTSTELAEMLTRTLKDEEEQGIEATMTELPSLDAMLRRFPREAIINNIVSNEELIPAKIVMDIALRSNSLHNIVEALSAQPPIVRKTVFEKLWSTQEAVSHIQTDSMSRDELLKIYKTVSAKLNERDLLDAYHSTMKAKLEEKMEETEETSLS